MGHFYGEFESTLDQRGRFVLPLNVLKQFTETSTENAFIISRGFEKCLTIYAQNSWDEMLSKINKLNDFDPKVRAFRRFFTGGATKVELDSSNRLSIPASLKEYSGLQKDIIITAAKGKFEIWDKQAYSQFFENTTAESFSDLARDVMADIDL